MIVTTYCTAQSLILQLISSDELLVLLWVSVIEVTVGAGGGPIMVIVYTRKNDCVHAYNYESNKHGCTWMWM